ncbi:alginate export family protein [Flavobacterium agrisoli]|uniref:Alginate export family protein n=1 Tax=Flavobacterium agrisoli TaxID=2793066 RepID=A0A934PPP7_9FLAO|nr:alginate export family protein [Flavobacterium agrisoli]MBK0371065.1 alginate export family protein [Flavobacterium agrisoli]
MKSKFITAILFFFICQLNWAQNQDQLLQLLIEKKIISQREADSLSVVSDFDKKVQDENKFFSIGLEFRPRLEYRNGYHQLRNDTTDAAFFVSQRSRINIDYAQSKFKFHTSIQDIRLWGQYGQISGAGSLNVFEAFVDAALYENLWIRLGRQKIDLDNGRIFSAANWSQPGRAHDGLNLIFANEKIESQFISAFSQMSERFFETTYSPTTFNNYKILNVHFLKAKLNEEFTLTTINAADSYESKTNAKTLYTRGTSGGRIAFEKNGFYATLSGYYQYGQLQNSSKISAFYLQPELRYQLKKLTSRLGAEIMSGDDATHPSEISKSFVPLYGVAWKFMGNMDYFTIFPPDVHNGGLINPYLIMEYELSPKVMIRSDFHLFYLQNKVLDNTLKPVNSYLGFENDLSLHYKWNSFTMVDFGFSYMAPTKSMEVLKNGDSGLTPVWSYVMVTFKPELFSSKK